MSKKNDSANFFSFVLSGEEPLLSNIWILRDLFKQYEGSVLSTFELEFGFENAIKLAEFSTDSIHLMYFLQFHIYENCDESVLFENVFELLQKVHFMATRFAYVVFPNGVMYSFHQNGSLSVKLVGSRNFDSLPLYCPKHSISGKIFGSGKAELPCDCSVSVEIVENSSINN